MQHKQHMYHCLTLHFTTTIDPNIIKSSRNFDNAKQQQLALLHSFLKTNPKMLQHLILENIAFQIGIMGIEDTERLMQLEDIDRKTVFHDAIEALPEEDKEYWRKTVNSDKFAWSDLDDIEGCFDVGLVKCEVDEVDEV